MRRARRFIGNAAQSNPATVASVRFGNPNAPIVVICDTPAPNAWAKRQVMGANQMSYFADVAKSVGLKKDDFYFIVPAPCIPQDRMHSMKQKSDWLAEHHEEFSDVLGQCNPKVVLLIGNLAARQFIGRAVKITKARGVVDKKGDMPYLPLLSIGYVLSYPEYDPIFKADMQTLKRFKDSGYCMESLGSAHEDKDYKYTLNIEELLDTKPRLLAVDTETTGLTWHKDGVFPFLVQMSRKQGESFLVPLVERYLPEGLNPEDIPRAKRQLKQLLEDPSVHKVGHNLKFDDHMLRKAGIEVKGWRHDTMQMAYAVDENLRDYSLDNCVRLWLPEMAGYSDELNRNYDKDKMIEVPPDVMQVYAGGDTDATYGLCRNLMPLIQADELSYKRYTHVVMPSLMMFSKVVEPNGLGIDMNKLSALQESLKIEEDAQKAELLRTAPEGAKRLAIEQDMCKGDTDKLMGSPKFIRSVLFSRDGFNLTPRVFTKANNDPSISADNHLVYFEDHEWVSRYMEHVKLKKMTSTYVNNFEKYITNERIHPSFHLHRTNTGRVASSDPNGQNIPKRGALAKTYRQMFIPREGYVIVEADYSQAELKIAACMAGDQAMIQAYRQDGDLHTLTAAQTMGLTLDQFKALDVPVQKQKRFEAKAINFGFIYGMTANGFKTYAKTQYGIDYTLRQAEHFRNMFFKSYPALVKWHEEMVRYAKRHGYVRAMHGMKRNLPSIHSKDMASRSLAERQAINAPVQLFASDLNLIAGNRFMRDANLEDVRVILTVHDAVILEVKEELAEQYASHLKWYMENNPLQDWFGLTLPVSLDAEVAIGPTYGDTEEDPYKNMQSVCPDYYDLERDLKSPMQFMTNLSLAHISY